MRWWWWWGGGGASIDKEEITNHIVGDVLLLLFFVSGIFFVNNYDTDFIYRICLLVYQLYILLVRTQFHPPGQTDMCLYNKLLHSYFLISFLYHLWLQCLHYFLC